MGFEVRRRLVSPPLACQTSSSGSWESAIFSPPRRTAHAGRSSRRFDGFVPGRRRSAVGPLLDSVTDVVSFGATPSLLLYVLLTDAYGGSSRAPGRVRRPRVLASATRALHRPDRLLLGVRRLSRRAAEHAETLGSSSSRRRLSGITYPLVLSVGALGLSLAMIAPFDYPNPVPYTRCRWASCRRWPSSRRRRCSGPARGRRSPSRYCCSRSARGFTPESKTPRFSRSFRSGSYNRRS